MSAHSRHIPLARLAEFAEGHLPAGERPRIEAHLATCDACAAEAATLARLMATMRADVGEDAPAHVIARAGRLLRQRATPPAPGLRARLLAALRFDSGTQMSAAFGVRSVGPAGRQLLYGAGDYELELRLTPGDGDWTLAGQLLGEEATGQLHVDGPGGVREVALSDQGEFRLPALPAGQYMIEVRLADADLALPPLLVGA